MASSQILPSPSGPNTKRDPSTENASSRVILAPSHLKASIPNGVLTTIRANRIWSPRPQPTTRQLIARRFVDSA